MTTPPNDPFSAPPGASLNGQPTEIPPPPSSGGPANSYAAPPPAYSSAPTYAQPPQYGGNVPYSAPQSGSKNSLGIISLVLGILGICTFAVTSVAGIILGHLAVSANNKGQANNKGLSIAGLVTSYFVTVAAIALVVISILVAPAAVEGAQGTIAKDEISEVGEEVALYYADNPGPAVVTFEDGFYRLDGSIVAFSFFSEPNLVMTGTTSSTWCVSIAPPEVTEVWRYSAANGLQSGAPCSGTPLTASDATQGAESLDLGESDSDLSYFSLATGDAWNTGFLVTGCTLNPYADGADWSALGVSCSEPHYGEIYAIVEFPEGEYPSDALYERQVDEVCYGQMFEDYVGTSYSQSTFEVDWAYPLQATWEAGNRQLVCMVVSSDGGDLEDQAFQSGR